MYGAFRRHIELSNNLSLWLVLVGLCRWTELHTSKVWWSWYAVILSESQNDHLLCYLHDRPVTVIDDVQVQQTIRVHHVESSCRSQRQWRWAGGWWLGDRCRFCGTLESVSKLQIALGDRDVFSYDVMRWSHRRSCIAGKSVCCLIGCNVSNFCRTTWQKKSNDGVPKPLKGQALFPLWSTLWHVIFSCIGMRFFVVLLLSDHMLFVTMSTASSGFVRMYPAMTLRIKWVSVLITCNCRCSCS